jgi:hypothetical protein
LSGLGPALWTQPTLRTVWLGGVQVNAIFEDKSPTTAGVVQMHGAADVAQWEYLGATGPVHMVRREWRSVQVDVAPEDIYFDVDRLTGGATLVWFPELPITDEWTATDGQVQFSTSRQVAYGLISGVTVAGVHYPLAWLNGVEQDVVTGTPGAGEVKISTVAGAQWRSITTTALEAGDVLRLRYYPVYTVRSSRELDYPEHNGLKLQLSLQEMRVGRFD